MQMTRLGRLVASPVSAVTLTIEGYLLVAKFANDEQPEVAPQTHEAPRSAGKGRPTPTRKEAQAAKAQPLVPNKRDKGAVKAQRATQRESREKARVGMMMGDERYLTPRDKGPQRRFVRDYVDSRFSIGEFMIPMMGLVLLMTFIPNPAFQLGSLVLIWAFVVFAVLDAWLLSRRVHRKLQEKFGEDNVQSGTKFYTAMRALQMRVLRVPKPQVKRGQRPE